MKITKTPYIQKTSFEPYTVTIYVESYEDEDILKQIANSQWGIPGLLFCKDQHNGGNIPKFHACQLILSKLMKALKS